MYFLLRLQKQTHGFRIKCKTNCAAGFEIPIITGTEYTCGSDVQSETFLLPRVHTEKSNNDGIDSISSPHMWWLEVYLVDTVTAGWKKKKRGDHRYKTTGCYWLHLHRSITTRLEPACRGEKRASWKNRCGGPWCTASSRRQGGFDDDDDHNGFHRVSCIDCSDTEQVPHSALRQRSWVCLHNVWVKKGRKCVRLQRGPWRNNHSKKLQIPHLLCRWSSVKSVSHIHSPL